MNDLLSVSVGALTTLCTSLAVRAYLEKTVRNWEQLEKKTQGRLTVELATIPARIVLGFLIWSIVWNAFTPLEDWHANDTGRCLLAWLVSMRIFPTHSRPNTSYGGILTGTYLIDLTVPRSQLSTLHYCMPAVLLTLVRKFASSGTPADALMCRVIMGLIFFGAVIGGIATTGLTFAFHSRRLWTDTTSHTAGLGGYLLYAVMLPVLTMAVVTGHFYIAAFKHWFFDEGHARYGVWVYLLFAATVMDLLLEVRFLYWFHKYEERYRDHAYRALSQVEGGMEDSLRHVCWLPKWRFTVLKVLFIVWTGSMLLLLGRSMDKHALMHLASGISGLQLWDSV